MCDLFYVAYAKCYCVIHISSRLVFVLLGSVATKLSEVVVTILRLHAMNFLL